jgi:UDP-glucose:(heptosyl)LPS alpha-1,3-glucosyltransferase
MKLAFCLFRYFPFGGLQRDFLNIAKICFDRGHSVSVFTMDWQGALPGGMDVSVLPAQGLTNHRRCLNFSKTILKKTGAGKFDLVVGFNKMAGLNVYFAADSCFKKRTEKRSIIYRWTPRIRTYIKLERSVFDPASGTEVLLISPKEKEKFVECYNTPEERFHVLPPGIAGDRSVGGNSEEIRQRCRREFGITEDELMLLMVGSGFKTKGLDRAIRALADLPASLLQKTKLFIIGQGNRAPFEKLASGKNVKDRIFFLGGRDDVPAFLLAADCLVHPAYLENAGNVLIESMASGLPVLATDICGYAFHVKEANAGMLIPSPFQQSVFTRMLHEMLVSPDRPVFGRNGLDYTNRIDVFSMHEKAADIIESVAKKRSSCF